MAVCEMSSATELNPPDATRRSRHLARGYTALKLCAVLVSGILVTVWFYREGTQSLLHNNKSSQGDAASVARTLGRDEQILVPGRLLSRQRDVGLGTKDEGSEQDNGARGDKYYGAKGSKLRSSVQEEVLKDSELHKDKSLSKILQKAENPRTLHSNDIAYDEGIAPEMDKGGRAKSKASHQDEMMVMKARKIRVGASKTGYKLPGSKQGMSKMIVQGDDIEAYTHDYGKVEESSRQGSVSFSEREESKIGKTFVLNETYGAKDTSINETAKAHNAIACTGVMENVVDCAKHQRQQPGTGDRDKQDSGSDSLDESLPTEHDTVSKEMHRNPDNSQPDLYGRPHARSMEERVGQPSGSKTICDTDDCHYMRWLVNLSVDKAKDPCDNFYEYVCSGANKEFEKQFQDAEGGMLSVMQFNMTMQIFKALFGTQPSDHNQTGFEKVVQVFQSCRNVDSTTPSLDQLERNATLEFLRKHGMLLTEELNFDPLDQQIEFTFYSLTVFFTMFPVPVTFTKTVNILMQQDNDFISLRTEPMQSAGSRRLNYERVMAFVYDTRAINETTMHSYLSSEDQVLAVANMNYNEQLRLIGMSYLGLVYGDQKLSTKWNDGLRKYTRSRLPGNWTLQTSVANIQLFHNLFGSKALVSRETLQKFIAWRTNLFLYNSSGHVIKTTMVKCFEDVLKQFPFAAPSGAIFSTISRERTVAVTSLVQTIQEEVETQLSTSSWLDVQTRKRAVDKISKLTRIVGYPLGLWNDEAINAYMNNIPDLGGPYIADMIVSSMALSMVMWDKILEGNSYDAVLSIYLSVSMPIYSANAEYTAVFNSIFITPTIMSRPAFIYGGPPEVNFGALGFVITHELMHGFDVTGRLFDGLGELNDWFTDMSRKAYEEREICHARSIENSPKARHFVDYPGEYLADTMGTDSLLKAYKKASLNSTVTLGDVKGLTSDQLFYVSRCLVWCGKIFPDTTHPPLDERCNVPLMNSDHFSDTFRCPKGAPMNSPIKCRFW